MYCLYAAVRAAVRGQIVRNFRKLKGMVPDGIMSSLTGGGSGDAAAGGVTRDDPSATSSNGSGGRKG